MTSSDGPGWPRRATKQESIVLGVMASLALSMACSSSKSAAPAGSGGGGSGMGGIGGEPGSGIGGVPAPCAPPIAVTGTATTVTVDLGAASIATVSPDLLGVHTAVYDGALTTDSATPALLKAAGVTSLRYPGGSYSDLYHWESHTAHGSPAAGQGSNVIYVADTANFGRFVSLLQSAAANAFITVNYGMNSTATGPAVPEQAAAWVAYANGTPDNTTPLGTDVNGVDWHTVGYWAGLRASVPLAVDTVPPTNFLRINRPEPVGIKNWEIGNEIYGNGYYHGSATFAGWETDLHAPYDGANGTLRRGNPALAPAVYGMTVRAFAAAMKAVDPTVQVGGIISWPDDVFANPTNWNSNVLGAACASMDFAVAHWYPGSTIVSLLPAPRMEIPAMYSGLRGVLAANCPTGKGGMPIAISEWGPNINQANDIAAQLTDRFNANLPPTNTQIVGIFAAESYATFMEQGIFSAHWAQMHIPGGGYLEPTPANNWGYHGAQMAHYFAHGGDNILPQPTSSNALLYAHASQHADGMVAVMLTNTSPTAALAVTVNVTGGAAMPLGCSGFRYGYTSAGSNLDGPISAANIFSATNRTSFAVAVPAYSVVVVTFPRG